MAEPKAVGGLRHRVEEETEEGEKKTVYKGYNVKAGQRLAGMDTTATGLRLAKGALGKRTVAGGSRLWERQKLGVRTDSSAL